MSWFKLFKVSMKAVTGLDKPLEIAVKDVHASITAGVRKTHKELYKNKAFREACNTPINTLIKADEAKIKAKAAKKAAEKAAKKAAEKAAKKAAEEAAKKNNQGS